MNSSVTKRIVSTILVLSRISILMAQEGHIKVKVTNGNETLPGATVTIGNITRVTNLNGEFSLDVKTGVYPLTVTHTGFLKMEDTVTIDSDSTQFIHCNLTPSSQMSEVTVVGSRAGNQRSNFNSPVPVQVYTAAQLVQTGQISLTQMLNHIAPSFNASREILNEPATLRGLDPQHVLILLNGVRYHNMAWLFSGGLKGQLGRGSVGNDLNSIPFAAIEKVELLSDGASAQYGSDAIAGVINIELKKTTGKTSIDVHAGQFYNRDGEKLSFGINRGFSLNNKGFIHFAASYRYQAPTFRGNEYQGTVYYDTTNKSDRAKDSLLTLDNKKINDRMFNRKNAVDNAGNAKLISGGLVVNGEYYLRKNAEIFWTAAINERKMERENAYRFPKNRSQVNLELYPDGFQPISKPNTTDISFIAGIQGDTKQHWHWDASSSYGRNTVKSFITNTNNASQSYLGTKAPTSFRAGKDAYSLFTNSLNFTKKISSFPFVVPQLNIGWGLEWRLESYKTQSGEEASWKNYDSLNYQQGGVGVSGPENAVDENRNVFATYLDIESDITKKLLLNLSGRYERYNDFGGNMAGKLALLFRFSDRLNLRASISNGFRAPSLQQRFMSSIQTFYFNSGGTRVSGIRGTFPNDHAIVKALDISPLAPEKSININGGFTGKITNSVILKADVYSILIKDRIVLSGTLDRTIPAIRQVLDSIPGVRVDAVQFFTNAIDTRTNGVDIMLDGSWKIGRSALGINLAANFISTQLTGEIRTSGKLPPDTLVTNTLFNVEEITKLEKGQPSNKIILAVSYKTAKMTFMIRNSLFGSTEVSPVFRNPTRVINESFSSKIITDASIGYSMTSWVTLTVGANNIFNVYPDRLSNFENTSQGSWIYSPEASPFGFNGGYYYAALSFKW